MNGNKNGNTREGVCSEDQLNEFQGWLISYLNDHAKETTDKEQHGTYIFKKLQECTLWDVEQELEYYFSYKIQGYHAQDVQCFIIPICSKWKVTIHLIKQQNLAKDPDGNALESYYHAQEIEVAPGLFLGSRLAAQDYYWLKSKKITHILTVAVQLIPLYPKEFVYKVIEVWDGEHVSLVEYFDKVTEWIDNAIQSGGQVLVHCFAGISRSTTFVCAYLMKKRKLSLEEALDQVKRVRPFSLPNPGFMCQLDAYSKLCATTNK